MSGLKVTSGMAGHTLCLQFNIDATFVRMIKHGCLPSRERWKVDSGEHADRREAWYDNTSSCPSRIRQIILPRIHLASDGGHAGSLLDILEKILNFLLQISLDHAGQWQEMIVEEIGAIESEVCLVCDVSVCRLLCGEYTVN
jgi:hypothetical protein